MLKPRVFRKILRHEILYSWITTKFTKKALQSLLIALSTDLEWVREHTRIVALATAWERTGKSKELLLRSMQLAAAENWLATNPRSAAPPTQIERAYIEESRLIKLRTQRRRLVGALAGLVAMIILPICTTYLLWLKERTTANQTALRIEQLEGHFAS